MEILIAISSHLDQGSPPGNICGLQAFIEGGLQSYFSANLASMISQAGGITAPIVTRTAPNISIQLPIPTEITDERYIHFGNKYIGLFQRKRRNCIIKAVWNLFMMYSPGCTLFSTVYCAFSKNMTCIERARENKMAVVILIALLVRRFTAAARID